MIGKALLCFDYLVLTEMSLCSMVYGMLLMVEAAMNVESNRTVLQGTAAFREALELTLKLHKKQPMVTDKVNSLLSKI